MLARTRRISQASLRGGSGEPRRESCVPFRNKAAGLQSESGGFPARCSRQGNRSLTAPLRPTRGGRRDDGNLDATVGLLSGCRLIGRDRLELTASRGAQAT